MSARAKDTRPPMNPQTLELFTESAWGTLAHSRSAQPAVRDIDTPAEPPEFVETLGFPKGTPPRLLAQVLLEISATPPGSRVERLLSPGMLSRLFDQSAAQASYALAVLSVVESPRFNETLARLRSR